MAKGRTLGPDGPTLAGLNKELGRMVSARRRSMQARATKVKKRIYGQLVEVTVYPPADVTGDRYGDRLSVRETTAEWRSDGRKGTKIGIGE